MNATSIRLDTTLRHIRAIPVRRRAAPELQMLLFVAAHAPVGLLMRRFNDLSIVHGIAVLAIGLAWSQSRHTADRAVYAAAYLCGAEVLWRMTGGSIFYEFGKYASAFLLLAASRNLPGWQRPRLIAPLYFLLLLPPVAITVQRLGMTAHARQQISFNLSGPFALAVAAYVLSACPSTSLDLRRLLIALTAPMLGISAMVGYITLTSQHIIFHSGSNFTTSGGFGPNQVSATLGLGAFLCLFIALQTRHGIWRWSFLALGLLMITQSVITFSRGGVINAVVCAAFLGAHFLRQPRARITVISALILFAVLGTKVILPALDDWTGGKLSERYASVDPSLRRSIAEQELRIWRDNPIFGVGPGGAKDRRRAVFGINIAAHTEYTRMLAEHGIFGALALLLLVSMGVQAYLRAPSALTKAWAGALAGWAMLEMSHAAMRIGVISLLFGLAMIRWHKPPRRGRRPVPKTTSAPRLRPIGTP